MAVCVSLVNMKGGVGKTTLAVNLAWYFADRLGKRVLLVDLDPQFNATQYLIGPHRYREMLDAQSPTVWHVLEENEETPAGRVTLSDPRAPIVPVVPPMPWESKPQIPLWLLPSQLQLWQSLKRPGSKDQKLARFLQHHEADFDLILIDCAPTESLLTLVAYHASDFLLVPVKPEYLSAIGLNLLVSSMEEFNRSRSADPAATGKPLQLAGIVFNSYGDYAPEEIRSKQEVHELARGHNWHVLTQENPFSRSFPKGARECRPVWRTSRSHTKVCQQFYRVAEEFRARIGI